MFDRVTRDRLCSDRPVSGFLFCCFAVQNVMARCELPAIAEANVAVSLYQVNTSNGALQFVFQSPTDRVGYARPVLTPNSLQKNSTGPLLGQQLLPALLETEVKMYGQYLWSTEPDLINSLAKTEVFFGPVSQPQQYRCPLIERTTNFIRCRTEQNVEGGPYAFTVKVGERSTRGEDTIVYPVVPFPIAVSGCNKTVQNETQVGRWLRANAVSPPV